MKKNKMMRIASVLLVAVLLSTCAISGTFAKYTSTASGTDTARVAKWSVTVEGTEIAINPQVNTLSINLFDTVTDDATTDGTTDDTNVANGSGEVIIAPGTGGKFVLDLANLSEVAAKYSVSWTVTSNTNNIPIQYSTDGVNWSDQITTLDVAASEQTTIAVGGTAKTQTVYWRWAFDETVDNHHNAQNDTDDTNLGILSQNNATAPTITVMATVTFTQVD